jgi:type I restriction enzyme S subunit
MKPGYKQTDVGVIPEEWEVAQIGETATKVGSGITPTGGERVYKNEGRPFLRSQNVGWGALLLDDVAFIDDAIHSTFAETEIKRGDVFLNITGASIGRSSVADNRVEGGNVNQHVCIIRADQTRLSSQFLNYLVLSTLGQRQIDSFQAGGNRQGLNFAQVRSIRLPVPPLPEQCAIAEALSDVDALLGGLDRLIAKKRDIKQAAMQQLLTGQTRLPGFQGEWEVKTLFDLAARKKELFDDGDWIESEHITTEGIRLIQTGNIGIGSFVEKGDKKYINEPSFTSLRCKELKQGDLLVCRLADPAGRACVLGDIGEERIVTSVDVTIFRPPSNLADRVFLSQVFSTSDWFRSVSDRSGGTTHKRISRGALGRLSINLPPLPEQTAIATVLSEMDVELVALEQRREKTRALKQGMMQELLTGRTRLV